MYKVNSYATAAIVNIGLMILIGFAVWHTDSATPLWALLLLASVKASNIDAKCPACGCEFIASKEKNEVV